LASHRLATALAAAAIALVWNPASARACSVCLAGDPRFSEQGTSAQQAGDVSVYLQLQGWRKQSGSLAHGHEEEHEPEEGEEGEEHEHASASASEENRSQRLDLFVSWTPLDRLTLTVDLPWVFNEIEETSDGVEERNTLAGYGDVALSSSVVLWRNREVLASTWLEGRAFVKAPTGRTSRERGGVVDPHLQTGTGSWDYGFGAAATHRLSWASIYASGFYRENGEGDFDGLDYEYGDVVLANVAAEVPVGHAFGIPRLAWLTVGSELNYRWAERDRADGDRYEDSGGSILYATPSLRVQLPAAVRERPASLRVAVQVPTTSAWLDGDQDEEAVWSVGLLVPY
jgi:hypothetical protein